MTYVWLGIISLFGAIPLVAYLLGRKSGRDEISVDVAEKDADNLRRQDKAGAEAAAENVVDRLRRGGF